MTKLRKFFDKRIAKKQDCDGIFIAIIFAEAGEFKMASDYLPNVKRKRKKRKVARSRVRQRPRVSL